MKLNIGSGNARLDGYINLDLDWNSHPDVVATVVRIPLGDNSIECIEARHVIEHLFPWEAQKFLEECNRILRPGGLLGIECPNLRSVVRWLVEEDDFTWFSPYGLGRVYGDAMKGNSYMMHKWGYTPETLTDFLASIGFINCRSERPQSHVAEIDLRIVGEKVCQPRIKSREKSRNIYWFLYGDSSVGSVRVQGKNIHNELLRQGIDSELLLEPPFVVADVPWTYFQCAEVARLVSGGIAIFQKLKGRKALHLLEFCKEAGAGTIYIACDHDMDNELLLSCDYVVCPSQHLVEIYRNMGCENVVYIPDHYEIAVDRTAEQGLNRRRLTVGWLGEAGHWNSLIGLEALLKRRSEEFELLTLSNHPDADLPWSLENLGRLLRTIDIAVIPTEKGPYWESKSSNRLITFMASGIPTIAGPIPAYEEIVEHAVNGYIAETWNEVERCLDELRDSQKRKIVGARARSDVKVNYSKEIIVNMWKELFAQVSQAEPWKLALTQQNVAGRRVSKRRINAISQLVFALEAYERGRYGIAYANSRGMLQFLQLRGPEKGNARLLLKKLSYGMGRKLISSLTRRARIMGQ